MENKTDFDASYNQVTLDLDELRNTAIIAVSLAKECLNHRLEAWYKFGAPVPSETSADYMLDTARQLHQATISAHYISLAYDHRDIVVVKQGGKTVATVRNSCQ